MQPEDADNAYLWDMLDAAKAVQEFVAGKSFNDYLEDRMLRGAVERHVEIIGEAANKVSQSFQEEHAEIPWRSIIGQRHVLAHEYGEIKHELMWNVINDHLPELTDKLEKLIPPPPE
jgi:uncharacterized protein with HEPN domain